MQLLATLKASDVEDNPPDIDYDSFGLRTAARAIVLDDSKVALIHVSKFDYYMLPGGGVNKRNIEAGLRREILEELGCSIDITGEVGTIAVYNDRWKWKQTDYCYTAKKLEGARELARTTFEIEEGHVVVWADNLMSAVRLVENAHPVNRDGKLVRARDLLFLQTIKSSSIDVS